jgi:hypothetical protein
MIIGISGRAGAGKDTVAELFIRKFGFKRVSFADSLKEVCSTSFDIPLETFHDVKLKDKNFEIPILFTNSALEKFTKCLQDTGCVFTNDQINKLETNGLGLSFVSPRDLLQRIGTDLVRKHLGDNFWINIFKNKIKNTQGHTIVTDVRFLNEREAIRDLGGVNFLVIRSSLPPLPADAHESELLGCSPENIQVTVTNDDTVAALHRDLESWWGARSRVLR